MVVPYDNLSEIIDALILLIKKPNASLDKILEIIQGPDFSFGGEIRIKKKNCVRFI